MKNSKNIKTVLGILLLTANILLSGMIILGAISTPSYGVAAASAAKANKFLAEENYNKAAALYTEAALIVKNLESKSGYFTSAAYAHLKAHEHKKALASLVNAIENNPVNGSPYQVLEWVAMEITPEKSITDYFNKIQNIDGVNKTRFEYIAAQYTQRIDRKTQQSFTDSLDTQLAEALKLWY